MIRKVAIQLGACALFACIAVNAFLAVKHLRQLQADAALTLESSMIQADIANILKDMTDMETGQRGYLLTADTSYLQPYNDAKNRIESDFAGLRTQLRNRSESEQVTQSELESLAQSKQAEMERSISLRQQGYRRRAFRLVDSNEGLEYMNKARGLLSSLNMAESSRFAEFDRQKNIRLRKALVQIVVSNTCLLLLAACLFGFIRYYIQLHERDASDTCQKLAVRNLQLERLTSALSNQARFETSAIQNNAQLLLQNYGGFLPQQGHQYAVQIREASVQMELLRQSLVDSQDANNDERTLYDSVA